MPGRRRYRTAAGVEQGLGDGDLRRRAGGQVAEQTEECLARVCGVKQGIGMLAQPVELPGEDRRVPWLSPAARATSSPS